MGQVNLGPAWPASRFFNKCRAPLFLGNVVSRHRRVILDMIGTAPFVV